MKKSLALILVLVMLLGMLPMQTLAAEAAALNTNTANQSETDLFVFAGQSNMMGAAVLEPQVNSFTDQSLEYKYMPKLRGEETGDFVSAQNPAGEWYYNDLEAAYGDNLNNLSYKSTLSNYSANTYFCPAMSDGRKGFSAQSESNTYAAASLAPYFVTEYASYGHSSIYAHMAKGSAKIIHYFTEEMKDEYNTLISAYNAENNKTYRTLTSANLTGAGDAFDAKYTSMVEDYADFAPDKTIANKSFVWLQGESDGGSYIEYKLKMQVLWEHLQELGFENFFVLRVGYWGSTGILDIIKAQEDFCAENENCYIVTRAPSLIPHPTATTDNWWINEPDAEYANCRDSYLVNGSSNHHFNEKAMQIFADRSAENIHRILHLGLDPILEEENIQGMPIDTDGPENPEGPEGPGDTEEELPEDTVRYTSYFGTGDFYRGLAVSKDTDRWVETSSSTAASTDLIPVTSSDSVWLQYIFIMNETRAVGGFYDKNGALVAPLYYRDFGFSSGGGSGAAAFRTPEETNRVSIADIEAATGTQIAYVRFTAWQASAGGHANTEARIYHEYLNEVSAAELLAEKMQLRKENIKISIVSNDADYSAVFHRVMENALTHTGDPTAGDYLRWHRNGYSGSISYYPDDTGLYYYDFTYNVMYYTTAQQEQALDEAVADLLEQLDLEGKSDYQKILGVYDYITRNISYDYTNLNNDAYKLKYTAYAALINKTAVCQGYANLFYRLMLELGVDCRIITGIGNGGPHGWNIVCLEGKYYNLDATWDAPPFGDYDWFLLSQENFADHVRDAEYETAAFHADYPMGTENYVPVKYGDVNADGAVDGNDATLLLQYAAGWSIQIDLRAADVNADGAVDGNDATLLLQYAAGWNVTLGAA